MKLQGHDAPRSSDVLLRRATLGIALLTVLINASQSSEHRDAKSLRPVGSSAEVGIGVCPPDSRALRHHCPRSRGQRVGD